MTEVSSIGNLDKSSRLHFLLVILIFSVYGVQVCPFLDSLSVWELVLPVVVTMVSAFVIQRMHLASFEVPDNQVIPSAAFWRYYFSLFVVSALVLVAYNFVMYDYPVESALKVLLGLGILGFFIATDLTLNFEYQQAEKLKSEGKHLPQADGYMPITRKFTLFACINALCMAGIIFLVVQKDLLWLLDRDQSVSLETARLSILFEVAFVAAVILAYTVKVIRSYSRNLEFFLTNQNHTLSQVSQGNLEVSTPVASQDEFGVMAYHTNQMISDLQNAYAEVKQTRDVAILGLSSLAETRDNETGAHILRTQFYVKALAEYLKDKPKFSDYLDDQTIDLLYKSAPLHDVGKVGIPDAILLKPGKLTDEEFAIMKQHPMIGSKALATAENELGSNSFLHYAREISETHHEKWDGSGYPKGLQGEDIPLSGRLMALADVYDALISKRVYKPAFSHEKSKGIILEGKGSHFDPDVVDAFLACEQAFVDIANRYSDESLTETEGDSE